MSIVVVGTQLAQSVKPAIQAISVANGYLTDLGGNVHQVNEDNIIDHLNALPAVLIRTGKDRAIEQRPGIARRARMVTVEVYLDATGDYESVMDAAAVDIHRALVPSTLEQKIISPATDITLGEFDYDHPQPGERMAVLSVEITFDYIQHYR